MMKKYLLTSIAMLSAFGLFAQSHEGHEKCGANIVLEQQLQDPENRAKYDAFQEAVLRYTSDPRVAVSRAANGKRIIPVVFHILHDGGGENISLNKVQQQMDVLNEDYSRLNPDTVNTPERFYGDTEYTHFAFKSDSIVTFIDDSAYVLLHNLAGESFAFHFNDGSTTLSDSLSGNFNHVVEVSISSNADTAALASAFANAVNAQNGLNAVFSRDTIVTQAPNFTVDGNEVPSLSYTSEHTYTTSFVSSHPSFTVDGLVVDTLFYTTEHTFTTSWNGTETDTTYSDTLLVELFEDAMTPQLPTDTLNVFSSDITYDVFDGSGSVIATNGFATEDTLILPYHLVVDTTYSDTLMVVLFENASDPFLATDTLYVFSADVTYDDFDETGAVVATNSFVEEGNLVLAYTTLTELTGQYMVDVRTNDLGYVEDYLLAGLWGITGSIPQQGSYLPADANVEFRLATKDPLGNCTDGVVRVFTSKTNGANDGTGFKRESYWNSFSYLNIWSVANIDMSTDGGNIILGYAQFPITGPQSTDGIAVLSSNINTRGNGGRTATHEVGHWLGLRHIWGDAECGSDAVFDTPTAEGPNYGVCGNNPAFIGQFGGSSTYYATPYNLHGCDPSNPDGEMFSNYMDYSSDMCMNMFTRGQKARMDFTFYGDETDPGARAYLISQTNLEATGTADPYTVSDCAPISAFYFKQGTDFATQKMICAGEEVDFKETAYNGEVTDYAWAFDGGNPSASTNANPNNILYDNAGTYDVTLKVSNNQGNNSHTATDMIIVSSTTAQYQSSWGYVDSFWEEQDFLEDYVVFNEDDTQYKWEWYQNQNGGSTGWESVRMFNYYSPASEVDEVISPSYDLSGLDHPTLQFRYSGASVNNEPNDQLRIMVSDDCGESWTTRKTMSGFDLTNSGLVTGSYRPNQNSTWTDVSVGLGAADSKPNVRVKFRWVSGSKSNNFYIDDLTIATSPLGMDELERELDLSVAPNPTTSSTTVTMNLMDDATVEMEVMDVLGRDARKVLSRDLSNGTHKFDIDLSSYADGVYYLRIFVDNNMVVKKIVKN